MSYKQHQKNYYDQAGEKIQVSSVPGPTGWQTNVPAPDFCNLYLSLSN